ncbi:MAG: sugar nucleotide-binding protein [Clostridia bacterium]|nr:sugar nucleotide-binding protein [Clostridia bacterium]
MKILVTGANGFVGSRIMDALGTDAVAAPSLRNVNEADILHLVDRVQPDAVIHTAAISDIGTCERLPDASYKANVEIPVYIARTGIKTVIFSSDQVYGGCTSEGPFPETETAPANLYARQKMEMENRTLECNPDTVLLRATWMYDMPRYGTPNRGNFLVNMLFGERAVFSSTQHRAVTYVREVAAHIGEAMTLPGGVYNYGSENAMTMLETAEWLKKTLNLRITLTDAGERCPLWMDCAKLKQAGIEFDNTADGLLRCIKDYALA